MKHLLLYSSMSVLLLVTGSLAALFHGPRAHAADNPVSNAHDFKFNGIDGTQIALRSYEGHAIIIVNTASECGFTHQYEGLQALWTEYEERGLVVIGVPSNDFGGQEPGTEEEIQAFCEGIYNVDFPLTAKTVVRGDDAHPFYRWARAELGVQNAPRWNFHKYLVAPDGRLVSGFATTVRPDDERLRQAIEALLPTN